MEDYKNIETAHVNGEYQHLLLFKQVLNKNVYVLIFN